jgi:hypothetical protein
MLSLRSDAVSRLLFHFVRSFAVEISPWLTMGTLARRSLGVKQTNYMILTDLLNFVVDALWTPGRGGKRFLLIALLASLGLPLPSPAAAQTFTILHNFSGSDGMLPYGRFALSSNTPYQTAFERGSAGNGTVFAINTDGTGFTNLYTFTTTSDSPSTNTGGITPFAGLVVASDVLYGAAQGVGSYGGGTVFSVALPRLQLTLVRSGTNVAGPWRAQCC